MFLLPSQVLLDVDDVLASAGSVRCLQASYAWIWKEFGGLGMYIWDEIMTMGVEGAGRWDRRVFTARCLCRETISDENLLLWVKGFIYFVVLWYSTTLDKHSQVTSTSRSHGIMLTIYPKLDASTSNFMIPRQSLDAAAHLPIPTFVLHWTFWTANLRIIIREMGPWTY